MEKKKAVPGKPIPLTEEEIRLEARRRSIALEPKATQAQQSYLQALLDEGGFTTLTQRNGYLSRVCERTVRHLDDLTYSEAVRLLDELKECK